MRVLGMAVCAFVFGVVLIFVLALSGCCSDASCGGGGGSGERERYGTVKIALGPAIDGTGDWREDQRAVLRSLDTELDALGPDFVFVPSGDPQSIVIRPAALPQGTCGRYQLGDMMVEVDPTCVRGYEALRKAAAHEVVHAILWLRFGWAKHLCWYPLNSPVPPECHPSLVCRECLMSPGIQPEDTWGDGIEQYTPGVAISAPQPRDIELVRGCYDRGRCE